MPELSPGLYFVGTLGDIQFVRGTFVLNGSATITIAAPQITGNSTVDITLKTVGGTVGAIPAITTITPGVGFTVIGTAGDTSTYNFAITG